MNDVMVFTPVYRLEPETIQAVFDLEWDGAITWVFQEDNPRPGADRVTGVQNHLHQYRRGRELFLQSRCEAMLIIESDIIPPPDTLKRLAALDTDLAYGVYVFRTNYNPAQPIVNIFERYQKPAANVGESLSLHPPRYAEARKAGAIDCSGAGLGCVLVRRHVLEQVDFRTLDERLRPTVHCDSYFTQDVFAADFSMRADMNVLCGHVTPEGEVLWPPS